MKKLLPILLLSILFYSCDEIIEADPDIESSITYDSDVKMGEETTIYFHVDPDDGGDVFWHVNGDLVISDFNRYLKIRFPHDGDYTISTQYFSEDCSYDDENSCIISIPSPGTTQYTNTKKLLGSLSFKYTLLYSDEVQTVSYRTDFLMIDDDSDYNVFDYDLDMIATYNSESQNWNLLYTTTTYNSFYVFNITGTSLSGKRYVYKNETDELVLTYDVTGSISPSTDEFMFLTSGDSQDEPVKKIVYSESEVKIQFLEMKEQLNN